MDHDHNDIGNYRIRTEIKRKDWRLFFIEVCNRENEIYIDFLVDRTQENIYDKHLTRLSKKRFTERNDIEKAEREKYVKQPYYHYRSKEANEFLYWKEACIETVLDLTNFVFGTNFKEIEVESYLLETKDYLSTDPA